MKILYVTSKGGIHDYRFLSKLINDYDVLMLHYAADDLIPEISDLPLLKIISQKTLFKAFPLATRFRHFKQVVNSFKPDLIHTGYVWQVGILAAIANVHPHLAMPYGSDILIEPYKHYFIRKIVAKVLRNCDHIQCDALVVKSKIVDNYGINPDKITVFPWGVNLDQFKQENKTESRKKLKIDTNKFIIIFNRSLEQVYGIDFMLHAFLEFSKNKDDVLLLIASDGLLKNEILSFISKNNLNAKVRVLGWVPNSSMPAILNASDIYISTSLSDGTSLSLLEAMACGLGVVVTDVPAIKEWVSAENGILVERCNINKITEALENYYRNRGLINSHGQRNVQIAKQRADWDENYLKLKEIYSLLAGGK